MKLLSERTLSPSLATYPWSLPSVYVLAAEIASAFAVDTSDFEANTEPTSVFTDDVTAVISKEILLSTTLIYESSPTYTSVSFFAGTYILFGLFWNSNTKYKSPTTAPS